MSSTGQHKTRSLVLISMLHAFTHLYQVALMPLYLPMQKTFQLPVALLAMVVAGVGGSFFHPAATALIARLYPTNTGRALGIIGIGAGVGFFIGPIYAGWRATQSGDWRAPVLELGLLGLGGAAVFRWLAEDTPTVVQEKRASKPSAKIKMFHTPAAAGLFIAAAFAFSLRDFAGSSMGSLGSLFLQNAHGYSLQQTGVTLSGMGLYLLLGGCILLSMAGLACLHAIRRREHPPQSLETDSALRIPPVLRSSTAEGGHSAFE